VGIDRSFSLFNLYVDGGFIILGIFLLSVYLYVTAFRSLMKAAEVARPFRSVDQLVKQQDWGARIGRPWQSFLEQIQRSQFDREDVCSYFQQARKRLSREANADLLRLKISIAAAPLLGLLGTIIGMIETFDAISIVFDGCRRNFKGSDHDECGFDGGVAGVVHHLPHSAKAGAGDGGCRNL